MAEDEIDAYLDTLSEPQRSTLGELRDVLAELLPESSQGISYGVPCFKLAGKGVAGFAAYAKHCSYLPMSGSVTLALADHLEDYVTSKGAIQFASDEPLPRELVERLVDARLGELGLTRG